MRWTLIRIVWRIIVVNKTLVQTLVALSLLISIPVRSQAQPYPAGGFQGRIALSHDGNFNDEDDWGALVVTPTPPPNAS